MKYLKTAAAGCLLLCITFTNLCMPQKAFANSTAALRPALLQQNSGLTGQEDTAAVEYTIKTDKKEYKDKEGIVRGIVSFSYPQFTSSFPFAEEVNQQLRKKSRNYFKSPNAKSIKESTKSSIKAGRFYDYAEPEKYYWTTSCSADYNKNGVVSFCMTEQWYAGGVHNQDSYGLNYDLAAGRELTIKDVIPGNAKKEILKAAKKYCGKDTAAYEIIKNTKKYKFYFKEGTVYIFFGSYELGHGTSWDEFSVKGRYT